MSLLNFAAEFLPATKGNKQHDERNEKDECVHAYVYERICMLMFSIEFPTSGLGFPQHPRGPLSQHPTKLGVAFFLIETCAWTWISTTHTSLSVRDAPKPGVPVANGSVCVCVPLI